MYIIIPYSPFTNAVPYVISASIDSDALFSTEAVTHSYQDGEANGVHSTYCIISAETHARDNEY